MFFVSRETVGPKFSSDSKNKNKKPVMTTSSSWILLQTMYYLRVVYGDRRGRAVRLDPWWNLTTEVLGRIQTTRLGASPEITVQTPRNTPKVDTRETHLPLGL